VTDRLPIVLLHGYSASQQSFRPWRDILVRHGHDATTIHLGDYVSLSNEITIKDIAEGLDRPGLRHEPPLARRHVLQARGARRGRAARYFWLSTWLASSGWTVGARSGVT
jgi:hypothetical protein